MKKIIVFSDSHGNMDNMRAVVKEENPDMIIHLGDCLKDGQELHAEFPNVPFEQVPGNCDYSSECLERILLIEGKQIFICHGHTCNVKSGYLNLELKAKEKQVDAALFGHTHQAFYNNHNGVIMLNPGCVGYSTMFAPASYGRLLIDGEKNFMKVEVAFIE